MQTEPQRNPIIPHFKLNPFDALAIFEATPDPYLILNTDLVIVAVNNAYLHATSTMREQIIGRGIFDVFPDNPGDLSATGVKNLRTSLERVIKTKQSDRMAVQKYDIPDNKSSLGKFEERYWSPLNTPVLNEQDELLYIIHHVEDVTEVMKAKMQAAELEESEARFRQIANAMPQSVWTVLPDGTVNWCNDWWYAYTGAPRNAGRIDWQKYIHHEDRDRYIELRENNLKKKNQYSIEVRVENFKGDFRWHWSTLRPVRDKSGQLVEWAGIMIDIHDLTLAKEKIQDEEAKFRSITNAVPQIVWSTLPDGYHDYFNDRYYEFTGAPRGTMHGDDWIVFHHPDDRERLKQMWSHSLLTGEPYQIEYRMRHHSGEWRWVLGRALPIRNKEGKIIRWFGTCTDIHDQKQTQSALNDAILDREMFFSIASHELKSPLTALSLETQMQLRKLKLKDSPALSKENFLRSMEKINSQTGKLIRLVDEMLDLSRITSGKLALEFSSCDLCELFKEVLNRLTPQFQIAGVPVPDLEDCEDAQGEWDSLRIEQVITNLLTNALRYGNGKPVKVKLEALEKSVRLSVQDEGIGISEEAKDKIFAKFERATSTSKGQGLGLGLYITKEIVLAHGGEIWVESELGHGSTFHVELPKKPPTHSKIQ